MSSDESQRTSANQASPALPVSDVDSHPRLDEQDVRGVGSPVELVTFIKPTRPNGSSNSDHGLQTSLETAVSSEDTRPSGHSAEEGGHANAHRPARVGSESPTSSIERGSRGAFGRKRSPKIFSTRETTNNASSSIGNQLDEHCLDEGRQNEWLSEGLRDVWLSVFLVITLCVILAITALDIVSAIRLPGIATISSPSDFLLSFIWGKALLWTSLPSFLLVLYGKMFDWIVTASIIRQPFVELARKTEDGAPAKVSILLDYRKYWSLISWCVALRNGHYLLGFSMAVSLILAVIIAPPASHLSTTAPHVLDTVTPIDLTTTYDDRAFTAQTDLRPIFDTVAATRIYGGSSVPWTNNDSAFQAFSDPKTPSGSTGVTNLSVVTVGYYASLDCRLIPPTPDIVTFKKYFPHGGTLYFQAVDRGCLLSQQMIISNNITTYLRSWATETCDLASHYSRLSLLAGQYDPSTPLWLSDFSIISCIPSYWNATGALNVTSGLTQKPIIQSFSSDDNSTTELKQPYFQPYYETMLHEDVTFDPTNDVDTTDFGRLILYLAKQNNVISTLSSSVLLDSVSAIFSSVYAVMASTVLLQQAATPARSTGTIFSTVTRLIVVSWIAYTIIGVLLVVLCITLLILRYVHRHRSILHEEPAGLLAYAGILCESDVSERALQIRRRGDFEAKRGATSTIITDENLLRGAKCTMEGTKIGESRIIINQGPRFKVGFTATVIGLL